MTGMTFRNSKITYYGPHSCENCGVNICRMGREFGATAFTYPEGPIYPNTEWFPHVCDPAMVRKQMGDAAERRVKVDWPQAHAHFVQELGYVILGEPCAANSPNALAISTNQGYSAEPSGAWASALERIEKGYPTWHVDLSKVHHFSDDLDRLPECPA